MKRYIIALSLFCFTLGIFAQSRFHYWFDDNEKNRVTETITGGISTFSVDASHLPMGIHTLNCLIERNGELQIKNAMFARLNEFDANDLSTMEVCVFVGNDSTKQYTCSASENILHTDMDFSYLNDGLHKLNFALKDRKSGYMSSVQSAYFLKVSSTQNGIGRYTYWINDETESVVTTELNTPVIPYHIIGLWDIEEYPFRTTSFELSVTNGELTAYTVNQFNFFVTNEIGIMSPIMTTEFVDERVSRKISPDEIVSLEPCENKLIGTNSDGEIKWFELSADIGDSLVFKTNVPCMMDLFSPSGERIWSCRGGDATFSSGIHAKEEGNHYLAIHDCSEYSDILLDYTLIDRYCVLSHTPKQSAQSNMLHMEFTGNGFDSLKCVELVSEDTVIVGNNLVIKSYATTSCQFNLSTLKNEEQSFDIKLDFGDEYVTVEDGFKLQKINKGEITVEVLPSYKVGTPYDVTIRITNTGNVPYWGVPFNIGLDKTGAGAVMEFQNFTPYVDELYEDSIKIGYLTENFLNTHSYGWYFPMLLPYIGSEEVIDLVIGFIGSPHQKVNLYAWTGEPWSEGFQKFLTTEHCLADYLDPELNYITAGQLCYYNILSLASDDSESENEKLLLSRGISSYDYGELAEEILYNKIEDIAEDKLEKAIQYKWGDGVAKVLKQGNIATNMATMNANVAQATGMAIGGTVNGLRLRNSDPSLYGIDPSDPTYSSLYEYRDELRKNMPHPNGIIARLFGIDCDLSANCCENANPKPSPNEFEILMDGDPNDILGYKSKSGSEYIGIDVKELPYCIEFENAPEIANAAANLIVVEDVLDPEIFDLTTFKPTTVTFSKFKVDLQGKQDYVGTLDMRPSINAIAEVRLSLDRNNGKMICAIKSLDPMTLKHTTHYMQGVLPVNTNAGEGVGTINFTVSLNKSIADGTSVDNGATITFGTNHAIDTPIWHNVTDFVRPVSNVSTINRLSTEEIELLFDSYDAGSGIWHFDLYCSTDSCKTWACVAEDLETPNYKIAVETDVDYRFLCIATDLAGNREAKEWTPEISYHNGNIISKISNVYSGKPDCRKEIFNLSGQKVSTIPHSGVYIINGRKIVLKQ